MFRKYQFCELYERVSIDVRLMLYYRHISSIDIDMDMSYMKWKCDNVLYS